MPSHCSGQRHGEHDLCTRAAGPGVHRSLAPKLLQLAVLCSCDRSLVRWQFRCVGCLLSCECDCCIAGNVVEALPRRSCPSVRESRYANRLPESTCRAGIAILPAHFPPQARPLALRCKPCACRATTTPPCIGHHEHAHHQKRTTTQLKKTNATYCHAGYEERARGCAGVVSQ